MKNKEIKYNNLKDQYDDIFNQRKDLEEKNVDHQKKARKTIFQINNLENDIENYNSEKKKLEEDKTEFEKKISNLEEEIKNNREKHNITIKKLKYDNDKEAL